MIFGAVQAAVEECSEWGDILKEVVLDLSNFLRDRMLRSKFSITCLRFDERAAFETWTSGYVDWKWEYMHRFLSRLLEVWPLLSARYDIAKLGVPLTIRGNGTTENDLLFRVAQHLQSNGVHGCLMALKAFITHTTPFYPT
jgi:hypothetical protein